MAGRHISEAMGALLAPRLLGYGTSQGAEAAVHAARLYLNNLQPCQVILKLDFRNAFNSILHDNMLCVVEDLAPELVSFVFSAYSEPSSLFSGDISLLSSEGVQQGDPLGPLLFVSPSTSLSLSWAVSCASSTWTMGQLAATLNRCSRTYA